MFCLQMSWQGARRLEELTGQVLVGGKPPSRMFMRRYTGYVEQFGEGAATSYMTLLLSVSHCSLCHSV